MFRSFKEIIKGIGQINKQKVIVAGAEEVGILRAIEKAVETGYIEPILIGNRDMITNIIEKNCIGLENVTIIHAKTDKEVANISCNELLKGRNSYLMKGLINTSDILRAIIMKKEDLMVSDLISHVSLIELPYYQKIIGLSDTSINIKPDFESKVKIVENTRDFFNKLGYDSPKISILSAIEQVNEKMQDTIDARELKKLNQEGKIDSCIIEGPISLDLSIDERAAKIKKYNGLIKGDADILIVPDLVSGNLLGKSFNYTPGSKFAGFVLGTKKTIVLTSRASTLEDKLHSIIIGAIVASEDDHGK